MRELVERFIKDFLNTIQVVRLYNIEHPTFHKALEIAMADLQEALQDRGEFVIGIVGEELTFESEIFFDLSRVVKQAILLVRSKGVERMSFTRGVGAEELTVLIAFIAERGVPACTVEEALSRAGVRHISAGKIRINTGTGGGSGDGTGTGGGDGTGTGRAGALETGPASPAQVYEHALGTVAKSLEDIVNTETIDHLALRFAMQGVLDNLTTSSSDFLKLVTLRRYDQTTYVHMLNVSVLAMYFSSRAGFCKDDSLDMGMGGLFHDIGKMFISRKILRKTDKLTDEEFAKIRNHSMFGAEILLKQVDSMGLLPIVVAFEHHVKNDLSGYPKSPHIKKQYTASGIISICDVYDALNQRRSYKSDYPPDQVYTMMIRDRGAAFDAAQFDMFFRIIGVWPIGVVLELSDGSIAVVRGVNEDDIFLPVVEVVSPPERRAQIDLRHTKDTLSIKRFLNPWKEGKDLLKMV